MNTSTLKKVFLAGLVLTIMACAKNPVTGERDFVTVSESEEIAQGKKYHQSILQQYGVYDDPELQQYVNRLGQALAKISHRKNLKFHFTVLDSPDINAFALPGGYIYITRGIMAYLNSEAELVGILGHEIGHVTARHSVRQQSGQAVSGIFSVIVAAATGSQSLGQVSQQLSTGLVRGYGRKHELEADRLGAIYLHKIGHDPENMLDVIAVLKDQEVYEKALAKKQNREPRTYHGVYSTHPKNDDRLKTVVRAAKKLDAKDYKDPERDRYLDMIDGMVWGPSVEQGIVVDNRFMHPGLGIGIQFPEGWNIHNQAEFLLGINEQQKIRWQMTLQQLEAKETPSQLLKRLTKNNDLAVKTNKIGASTTTQIKVDKATQPALLSAIKLDNSQALLIVGSSPESNFGKARPVLTNINDSFKRLSSKEIANIKPPRIKVINVKSSDKFSQLASKSALKEDPVSRIRLLNRAYPDGNISDYKNLKTIILD